MKNITYFNAGAGSGKTFKLTEILSSLFLEGKAIPENIILTTFTKKAAADFKRKAREKLLDNGMLDMVASLEDANMGTVHSVGLRYIRKYWYILGRSASFTEMNDEDMDMYISATLSEIATEDDINLFHSYVRSRNLKDYGKYRYDFWQFDLRNIVDKCETFGITDFEECRRQSLKHIDLMFPNGGADDIKEVVNRLISIAERWKERFDRYKEEHNVLSFNDMESMFLDLLENPIVQEDVRASVKYVFVDEFQDSNQTQLKIFDKLSDLVEHSYWVGDPKQAIYRFRGCDTELVTAIMEHLKESAADGNEYSRELDRSWRSVSPLVETVNKVFVPLFADVLDREDVELHAVRKDWVTGVPILYNWDLEGRKNENNRLIANKEMLYCAVAVKVNEILSGNHPIKSVVDKDSGKARKVRPSDMVVLCLTNSEAVSYIDAFREYDIPVNCKEIIGGNRAEIKLVLCLINYIISPNPLLLKAEISKLYYGKTLEDLLAEKFEYDIFDVLDEIRKDSCSASVSSVLSRLIYGLNLAKVCGRFGKAESRGKVLDEIIRLGENYGTRKDATLEGFVASFPEELACEGNPEGITVTTYHQSKGLEWPIVILTTGSRENKNKAKQRCCCGTNVIRKAKPSSDNLYSEFELRYCPLFLSSSREKVEESIILNIKEDFDEYWSQAVFDTQKLLYVGMTRARDYLITLSQNGKGTDLLNEAGLNPDIKNIDDKSSIDLWGNNALEVYFEKIKDERYVTESVNDEEIYGVMKESMSLYAPMLKILSPCSMECENLAEAECIAKLSERIPVASCPKDSYAELGTCIHNMFSVYGEDSHNKFIRIRGAYGMADILPDCDAIVNSISALYEYLKNTYGEGRALREHPFMHKLSNGQVVSGTIDLLWVTEKGAVIVDYKNYPGYDDVTDRTSDFYAGKYTAQIKAYEAAVYQAGMNVTDTLIYYSVQGILARINLKS